MKHRNQRTIHIFILLFLLILKCHSFECSVNFSKGIFKLEGDLPNIEKSSVAHIAYYESNGNVKVLFVKNIQIDAAKSDVQDHLLTAKNAGFKFDELYIITTKSDNKTRRSLWHVNQETDDVKYTISKNKDERVIVMIPKKVFISLIIPELQLP